MVVMRHFEEVMCGGHVVMSHNRWPIEAGYFSFHFIAPNNRLLFTVPESGQEG